MTDSKALTPPPLTQPTPLALPMTPPMAPAPLIVRVALPIATQGFDYEVPAAWADRCSVGAAVEVLFRGQRKVGYVFEQLTSSPHRLKPIAAVADYASPLQPHMVTLCRFVADYYLAPLGEALALAVPKSARQDPHEHIHLTESGRARIAAEPDHPLRPLTRIKTLSAAAQTLKLNMTQLREQLQVWREAGLIRLETRAVKRGFAPEELAAVHTPSAMTLTEEQQAALAMMNSALLARRYQAFLLEGVTGSGKTEVYLTVIEQALAMGRSAVVLVPEIGLTPQTFARFERRFGHEVVMIHSALDEKSRAIAWQRAQSGACRVIVGPRSALFCPLRDVGVIVVDEEHDDSYKQDETPRYHARDVALIRARLEGAVAILGSATPSLESEHNAQIGKLTHIRLTVRATGALMPQVEVVPLMDPEHKKQARRERKVDPGAQEIAMITPTLRLAIEQTIARKEQVILYLNRRGFAPFIVCTRCGAGFTCPSCSVSLTHHLRKKLLMCHYCGHAEKPPELCPHCQSPELRAYGSGTERLELEFKKRYPTYRIARLDRDAIHSEKELTAMLAAVRDGDIDLLIGTQMVTKGHDFAGVTLVGIVLADSGLHFPDFRAAERTAQRLVQVAGRAGRAQKPGRVMIQTLVPEHPVIVAAHTHHYRAFVESELKERKALGYPPYCRTALLRAEGEVQVEVEQLMVQVGEALRRHQKESQEETIEILGPAPCPLERLRGLYRSMLLMKGSHKALRSALVKRLPEIKIPGSVKLIIDIDPVAML